MPDLGFDASMEGLCARILTRHADTIRVKKPAVAVANLVRIVESTLDLANRKGFHGMSLRDLALGSGLSMGALYAYFDSKETLLLMILGGVTDAVDSVLGTPPEDRAQELATDPASRLRWLIRSHILLTEVMHPWFTFAFMEAKAFPREGRQMAKDSELRTEAMLATALGEAVERGLCRAIDPEVTAALIKPMMQDWYVKRPKHRRRGLTPDRYADHVIAFVEAAIGLVGKAVPVP